MLAFAIGGTPITTLIGTDENNLSWTATHPVGASIFTLIPPLNSYGNRISVDTQCSRRKWQRRRDSPEQNDCDWYVSVFATLKLSYSKILQAGQTTQCVTTPVSTPPFTVTANVTKDLQTCQPWGFTIKGGVPPYIITLAAPNSPIVTNVTIPYGNDAFTYIDRADPNGELMGALATLLILLNIF